MSLRSFSSPPGTYLRDRYQEQTALSDMQFSRLSAPHYVVPGLNIQFAQCLVPKPVD